MEPSEKDIVLARRSWSDVSEKKKAALYQQHPELRKAFMSLPGDKFFLFQRLDPSEWPDLGKIGYNVLDRNVKDAKFILKVLATLPCREAIEAFNHIREDSTRDAVLGRVTEPSRKKIIALLNRLQLGTDFSTLPTELVAEIARHLPYRLDRWNFALTNRKHFEICADIWVQEVENGYEIIWPYIAICCMNIFGEPGQLAELVGRFCVHVQARICKDISNHTALLAPFKLEYIRMLPSSVDVPENCFLGVVTAIRSKVIWTIDPPGIDTPKIDVAKESLALVNHLPPNTKIPDAYFLEVVTVIRMRTIHYIRDSDATRAKLSLELIKYLPSNTKIPKNSFLDVFTAIRVQAIRSIEGYDDRQVGVMLGLTEQLLANTKISDDYFLDVVAAIRARSIREIKDSSIYESKVTLNLIGRLPPNTKIPNHYFFDVVTAIRVQAVGYIRLLETVDAKRTLKQIKQLPLDTHIPENYFFDVVTAIRDQAVNTVGDGQAGSLLKLMPELPLNTRIPDDYFFDVVTAIRDRANQAFRDNQVPKAKALLELVSLLPPNTKIPNDYLPPVPREQETIA